MNIVDIEYFIKAVDNPISYIGTHSILNDKQTTVLTAIDNASEPIICNMNRQDGKTFIACNYALYHAAKHERSNILIITNNHYHCSKQIQHIHKHIPAEIINRIEHIYNGVDIQFNDGTTIYIRKYYSDAMFRGVRLSLCLIDDMSYTAIDSILKCQNIMKKVIILGTYSTMDHYKFMLNLLDSGRSMTSIDVRQPTK